MRWQIYMGVVWEEKRQYCQCWKGSGENPLLQRMINVVVAPSGSVYWIRRLKVQVVLNKREGSDLPAAPKR
jgi:hypothetical protein